MLRIQSSKYLKYLNAFEPVFLKRFLRFGNFSPTLSSVFQLFSRLPTFAFAIVFAISVSFFAENVNRFASRTVASRAVGGLSLSSLFRPFSCAKEKPPRCPQAFLICSHSLSPGWAGKGRRRDAKGGRVSRYRSVLTHGTSTRGHAVRVCVRVCLCTCFLAVRVCDCV